ncbi:MAG: acyl-CoA dehydrogenase family protein [Cyanophyceae cyanobacterium]
MSSSSVDARLDPVAVPEAIAADFAWSELAAHLTADIDPIAAQLDHDAIALAAAFRGLGARGWLGLRVPKELGGLGLSDRAYGQVRELLARHSGALAFLQAQHQSAAAIVAASDNTALRDRYLPDLCWGRRSLGISFSHLRRSGEPVLRAEPTASGDGYHLTGSAPWITGWGCFSESVVAATLPDGAILLALIPLDENADRATLHFSDPLPLAAMAATQTVSARCDRHFIPRDRCLGARPADWIRQLDRRNVMAGAFFALGCAAAALDCLGGTRDRNPWLTTHPALGRLTRSLTTCRHNLYHLPPDAPWEHRLNLRANAIAIAFRATQAAIIAAGGAANGQHHRAQRLYREAVVFAVTGQTPAIAQASLDAIAPDPQQPDHRPDALLSIDGL